MLKSIDPSTVFFRSFSWVPLAFTPDSKPNDDSRMAIQFISKVHRLIVLINELEVRRRWNNIYNPSVTALVVEFPYRAVEAWDGIAHAQINAET